MSNDNIQSALDFARQYGTSAEVLEVEHDGIKASVIVTPTATGHAITPVKQYVDAVRERPERRTGNLLAHDLDSFIALTNRDSFAGESVIFADVADRKTPKLVAVLDFHDRRNGAPTPREPEADWCKDRVSYAFPLSDEWKAWMSRAGEANKMTMEAFAIFVEDHLFDIGEPAAAGAIAQAFASKLGVNFAGPSGIMALSRGLEIKVDSRLAKAVKLDTGEASFSFEENHLDKNGAPLKVPAAFHVMIPIFLGGPLYSIPMRLRYRVSGSSVSFFYEPHKPEAFFDDAIKDALERVRRDVNPAKPEGADEAPPGGCGLLVVLGSPPA